MLRRPLRLARAALARPACLALALALANAPDARAITGVCPDGSVFVVRRAADIPCSAAKRVEPSQVPPLRPENLARPYLWELHREKQSENNPYNLLERAERVRQGGGIAPSAGAPAPNVAAAPPVATSAPPPRPEKAALGLTDGELRDLFYLVELSQQSVPATFVEEVGGQEAIRVSFAHSNAFEARMREAGVADGTVVLWSVQPRTNQRFQPNFTFVQGETAYHPQPGRARELDVLVGKIGGELQAEEVVLGYAVLPPSIDLARPMDLYWDDRRIAVTFR